MSPLLRGLALAALHLALASALGGKLLYDRATCPRVWVKTAPIDPYTLFRGRYVQLRLEVAGSDLFDAEARAAGVSRPVELRVEDDRLVAVASERDTGNRAVPGAGESQESVLAEPVAYFIPEHVPDPSRRAPDEELWVEVTVPKRGAPRPIRLGVRKQGELAPLD